MPRGLGFLLLVLVILSCTSGTTFEGGPVAPSAGLELGPSERAEEQRRSLRHVFYRNNEAPPTPSPTELRRLERDLEQAPPVEVEELHELFANDVELLAFATRDTDGDGVLDYRISEYRGKFFEGDIDLDGDGVRNVYDSAPYDRKRGGVDTDGDGVPDKPGSFADRDGDGIPDHLDWSRRKPEPLPDIQAGLFRDFEVILVERSARFSPELVHAVDDTLRYVFRERLPTLRTIAVEDQLLISPDLGDNGFMLGQTQTLTVCTKSLAGAEPVVLLGLMVHEVDHAWQLAQDFDESRLAAENTKMYFPPGSFTRGLARFGWEVDRSSFGEGYRHRLYWPHFYATSPRYLYRGSSPREWATWFEDVQRESGPEFLRNSPAVTWGMVGPYSLTSPWEWHADHLMAALYNRIDRGITEHDNRTYRNIAALLRAAMLQSVQRQWSRFDYRNAVGTNIDRELGRRFALTKQEVEILVDRYVIPLADFPMLSEALAIEAASPDSFSASLGAVWDDVREQIHEPLRHRPNVHALVALGLSPWRGQARFGAGGAGGDHLDEQLAELVPIDPEAALADSGADAELGAGEAPGAGELEAQADPHAEPGAEQPGRADAELVRRSTGAEALDDGRIPRLPARSGLPRRRGGAGRVGGVVTEPRYPPTVDKLVVEGEADAGEQGLPEAEPFGDVRKAVDPVVSLFEQLRRQRAPEGEGEQDSAGENELEQLEADEPSEPNDEDEDPDAGERALEQDPAEQDPAERPGSISEASPPA